MKKLSTGIPGKKVLRFAGCISQEDLQTMKEAIAEGCERVDVREWLISTRPREADIDV